MDTAKIRLSPEEAALVIRADWILTKNSIIQKTKQLLASLQTEQQHLLLSSSSLFPEEIINSSPKISKGENYKGLPYLVLDYPRYFNKEDAFAIRILFWWGNFFSGTLHLSGIYKKKYEEKIIRSFESLNTKDFSVCINENQWEHHFETDNYLPLHTFTASGFEEIISKRSFIKLSKKISLKQWNDAEKNLLEIFSQLISALSD
ncbi:MAG TPA: hypothetical protein VJ111_07370 [Chitinophagaceae bacterium]|nr:hypothetical protein [Chitinophagaceae bacterium]